MESNERVVVKFGDASLADGGMVRKAKMVFESKYREVAVVVSAMGETTDQLVEAFFQSGGTSDEDYADFVSMGERTSARLFSASLRSLGASSILLEPGDLRWPILTDSNFREANVDLEKTRSLVKSDIEPLISRTIPVLCRFLGVDSAGKLTTLGRGGSDTTALVLGNCLNADEVILVKDTNGILSADPRVVLEAKQFETISIEEMYSLAYCGAKIIKPEALRFKAMGQKLRVVSAAEGLRSKGAVITGDMSLNALQIRKRKGIGAISMVCDPNSERMTSVLAALDGAPVYGISSRDTVVTIYTSVQDLEAVVNRIHLLNVTKAVSSREGMGLVEVHNSHFDAPYVINEISTNLVFAKLEVHEIVAARTSVRLFINEPDLPKAVQVLEQLKL